MSAIAIDLINGLNLFIFITHGLFSYELNSLIIVLILN